MKVQLQIDRLILSGLPITAEMAPAVQVAIEAELQRLFAADVQATTNLSARSLASLRVSPIEVAPAASPAVLGAAIARSLHGGLTE